MRSLLDFCERRGWLTQGLSLTIERRREPADRTRAIPYPELERLWRRDDIAIREKALWRLLYESAARSEEVLSIDVEDLDLEQRRARLTSKGGDRDLLHFQTGSARLLPRLIAERSRGPRSLQRYARPGADAVAAVTAADDPARRRARSYWMTDGR